MSDSDPKPDAQPLYFFPDRPVTEAEAKRMLADGSAVERAEVMSHLLRYADWEDIWRFVSRDEVRESFADLDLPESLRRAWARMLKIEAVVT